jgi:predicted dehydrogenase
LPSENKIRVAVVGVGAFGRNHARVVKELAAQGEPVELCCVVDADTARAQAVAREFGTQAARSLEELPGKADAACIAVPTVSHLAVARPLIEAGLDLLIEKPLASSLEEADEIVRLARARNRIVQVGHLERFNPAVRATAPLITHPMFFEVHRLSIFTPRSLDVDVVLDLMIHDLDVVLSFVQSPVTEIRAVGLPILTGKVDIANVRMEFESGCVANFTASRVSTERVRKLRFFQPRQYVSLDYTRQDVVVFTVDDAQGARGPLDMMEAGGAHPSSSNIRMTKPEVKPEEPLHAELRSFLQAGRTRSEPEVGLEDGRRALAVALEVLDSIREHSRRVNLEALTGRRGKS